MKRVFLVVIAIAVIAFAPHLGAAVIGTADEEVRAIAQPILDDVLSGFAENDYTIFSRDFDQSMKQGLSEEKFIKTDRQLENSIGNCVNRKYLGFLSQTNATETLWKARFDKSDADVLIRLIISKKQNRYLVTGLWFQ